MKSAPAHQPWRRFVPAAVLGVVGLLAYANSFSGVFVFDDYKQIVLESRVESVSPIDRHLASRRPLVSLSLAANYQLAENSAEPPPVATASTWGFHLFNVLIHVLAAWALFGVIRRTLRLERFSESWRSSATSFAFFSSLLWLLHPLQTQSVTYLIQRAESMMGLFYLLTLYCVIRGAESDRALPWNLAAVLACTAGMASKAVMVTAPMVVLLYDRLFLSDSFKETFR